MCEETLPNISDLYNYIKQGYRRNNLIRLQTNDKGSGCNGNGYRYK